MEATIKGIEYILPQNIIRNSDLQNDFPDYDFQKFESKVGIFQRHLADTEETALDLAIKACNKLFLRFEKSSIDFVLYCTQSPEYILPTTACILQDKIGLNKNIGALDFNLGCSGYTYGLSLAKSLIKGGMAENVLLVTAETYSKYIHKTDRVNRSIFGDAATATIISISDNADIGEFIFGTDGSGHEKLIIKNSGSKSLLKGNKELAISENDKYLYMDGPEVFNFTINIVPESIKQIIEKNDFSEPNIDQFILHQANSFMLNHLRKSLQIEKYRFFNDLRFEGNTVSNTIPIALKKYTSSINSPQNIILLGFGVGLSWCGGIVKINNEL